MKELQFIQQREAEWKQWERWAKPPAPKKKQRNKSKKSPVSSEIPPVPQLSLAELPSAYRRLCHDLSLAQDRCYSSPLIARLQGLVQEAHQHIYGARASVNNKWLQFIARDFPALVRQEKRFVLIAAALFFIPLIATLLILQSSPEKVYLFHTPETVSNYESMYSPNNHKIGRSEKDQATSQVVMLGFYIKNNVQIDFQCFASGIVFGLGSIFFLVYNGLQIGSVAGHLTQLGWIETFWGFVSGHSAPELIGAVISGAAGLKIGYALIAPGKQTRLLALQTASKQAIQLLYGAAGLTFGAAFIEAFWSPLHLPFTVKVITGLVIWSLLLWYLLWAGRGSSAA